MEINKIKLVFLFLIIITACKKPNNVKTESSTFLNLKCTNSYHIKAEISHVKDTANPFINLFVNNNKGLIFRPDIAASGVRYVSENKKYTFWEHHGEFAYSENDKAICTCVDSSKTYLRVSDTNKEFWIFENNNDSKSLSNLLLKTEGLEKDYEQKLTTDPIDQVFFSDLNGDNKQDLAFSTVSMGSGSYGKFWALINNNDQFSQLFQIEDEKIDPSQKELFVGYQGHDNFEVKDGKIIRTFPIYKDSDSNYNPTGGTRVITYLFDKQQTFKIIDAKNN